MEKFVVIEGSSRSGKSAVIRALRGLATAESGNKVRHGEKEAKVVLKADDKVVGWAKGEGKNRYVVEGEVFDRVGTQVPAKVVSLLNLGSVEMGGKRSIVNFQGQHDAPFLISESGATVSEFLGSVSGLDRLFLAIGNVASDIKKHKMSKKSKEEDLLRLDLRVVEMEPVGRLKEKFDGLWAGLEMAEKVSEVLKGQQKRYQELAELRAKLEVLVPVEALNIRYEQVQGKILVLDKKKVSLSSLKDACDKLSAVRLRLKDAEELSKLEVKEASLIERLRVLKGRAEALKVKQTVLAELIDVRSKVKDFRSEVELRTQEIKGLLSKAETEFPESGSCPFCGQSIAADCKKEMLELLRGRYEV